jgi:hypothetical protein
MWHPRRHITLYASMDCYRDSFAFLPAHNLYLLYTISRNLFMKPVIPEAFWLSDTPPFPTPWEIGRRNKCKLRFWYQELVQIMTGPHCSPSMCMTLTHHDCRSEKASVVFQCYKPKYNTQYEHGVSQNFSFKTAWIRTIQETEIVLWKKKSPYVTKKSMGQR